MSTNIYVGNLSWSTSDADLQALFSQYGQVTSAHVIEDRETGRSRGFGFVEMDEDRTKLARDVSGGMQRRLSLAATLVHEPQLLFLDEPTAGIDPVLRRKFWDHFRELRDRGRTLFVTTQYVGEANYCDLVGVLAEGRLLMVDTPDGLRYRAYGGDIVDMVTKEPLSLRYMRMLRDLPFVKARPRLLSDTRVRLIVSEAGTDITELVDWARALAPASF